MWVLPAGVNGGGKVDHMGGSIVGLRQPKHAGRAAHAVHFLSALYIWDLLGVLKTGSHGVFESWTTRKSLKNPYRRHSSYLYPLSRFFSKIRWVF